MSKPVNCAEFWILDIALPMLFLRKFLLLRFENLDPICRRPVSTNCMNYEMV